MQTASSSAGEDQVKTDLRSEWAEPSMAYRCPYERDTHRETPLCKEARDRGDVGDRPGRGVLTDPEESGPDLELWASRLWERTFLLFRPPDMWSFVRPAAAHTHQVVPMWLIGSRKQQGFLLHEHSHSWGSFLEVTGFLEHSGDS